MDFSASTLWWVTAGVLVAIELGTGTFYLLMLALGACAGALAAHLGINSTMQVAIAAVVGGGATVVWHLQRGRKSPGPPQELNRDVQMDIGQQVNITAWEADGTGRAQYRGASWQVRHAGHGAAAPGPHVIVAVKGNELQLRAAGTH